MSLLSFFGSYFVKCRLGSIQLCSASVQWGWIWMCIRLLHPWDFPGKSARVDCHFLLQGIFSTQESNPGLLHYRQMVYCLSHQILPINQFIAFFLRRLFYFLLSSTLFILFKNFRISWRFISVFHGKKYKQWEANLPIYIPSNITTVSKNSAFPPVRRDDLFSCNSNLPFALGVVLLTLRRALFQLPPSFLHD